MRLLLLASLAFLVADSSPIQDLMEHAFYPVLLGILVFASLGLPIPEDFPLIAAGVLLKTHPGLASWWGTIAVAMLGIMTGDLVLYRLGRMWGMDVVNHRFVRRLITPVRLQRTIDKFHKYGTWFCFFGRFFMGVRAVMCMTAGATRFPYWRFFLADFSGALLSVPFFVFLGYWFAGMLPTLRAYVSGVQWLMVLGGAAVVGAVVYYEYRRITRRRAARSQGTPDKSDTQLSIPPTPVDVEAEEDTKPAAKPDPAIAPVEVES
ncbi:MAG: DedA family protein [Planctomycetota bacterium]